MRAEKDFEELLGSLNRNKARYCVIGAYALAFYGKPRYTKDMDILVEPTPKNAERIVAALKEFGFKNLGLKKQDFVKKGNIIQLGYEPVRIDFITSIKGCGFAGVWKNKKPGLYGKQKIFFIGINELIRNKKAVRRSQDKADLDFLRSVI